MLLRAREVSASGLGHGRSCLATSDLPGYENAYEPVMEVIDSTVVEAGKDAGEGGVKRRFVE